MRQFAEVLSGRKDLAVRCFHVMVVGLVSAELLIYAASWIRLFGRYALARIVVEEAGRYVFNLRDGIALSILLNATAVTLASVAVVRLAQRAIAAIPVYYLYVVVAKMDWVLEALTGRDLTTQLGYWTLIYQSGFLMALWTFFDFADE